MLLDLREAPQSPTKTKRTETTVISTDLILKCNMDTPDLFITNDMVKLTQNTHLVQLSDKCKLLQASNPSTSQNNKRKYSFNKSAPLIKEFYYQVIKAKHKDSNTPKVAKIINKKALSKNKELLKKVKIEILLHQFLKKSDCIVKLEDIFESAKHIYLIFEEVEFFEKANFFEKIKNNTNEMKEFLCSVLIAVNEVNSMRVALAHIDPLMVALTPKTHQPKLFNFLSLIEYGEKVKTAALLTKLHTHRGYQFLHPDRFGANPCGLKTDAWAFGAFMAYILQDYCRNLKDLNFGKRFLRKVVDHEDLGNLQSDLLECLLRKSPKRRLGIADVLVHDYFRLIFLNKNSKKKIEKKLGKLADRALDKLTTHADRLRFGEEVSPISDDKIFRIAMGVSIKQILKEKMQKQAAGTLSNQNSRTGASLFQSKFTVGNKSAKSSSMSKFDSLNSGSDSEMSPTSPLKRKGSLGSKGSFQSRVKALRRNREGSDGSGEISAKKKKKSVFGFTAFLEKKRRASVSVNAGAHLAGLGVVGKMGGNGGKKMSLFHANKFSGGEKGQGRGGSVLNQGLSLTKKVSVAGSVQPRRGVEAENGGQMTPTLKLPDQLEFSSQEKQSENTKGKENDKESQKENDQEKETVLLKRSGFVRDNEEEEKEQEKSLVCSQQQSSFTKENPELVSLLKRRDARAARKRLEEMNVGDLDLQIKRGVRLDTPSILNKPKFGAGRAVSGSRGRRRIGGKEVETREEFENVKRLKVFRVKKRGFFDRLFDAMCCGTRDI